METQELTIFQKLEALKLSTGVGENAPYSDHEFVRILQEGEREQNLDKIYMFIEACERGCGYRSAYQILPMLEEAYEQSPKRMFQIIAGKRHVEKCIILSLCEKDMLCEAIRLGCEKNMEMLYEALRQLVKHNANWTEEEEKVFISGIVLLSAESKELWVRWIKKEEYKGYWMKLLGKVLPKLSEQAMCIYANTIRIDMDVRYHNTILTSLGNMDEKEEEYVLSVIGNIIVARWENHLEVVRKSKKYHNELLFSAYNVLIYNAILRTIEDYEMWNNEVNKCIGRMYEGLSDWYTGKLQMATVFYVDMTRLYTLLHIGETLCFKRHAELENNLLQLKKYLKRYDFFEERYL